ncbi:RICIN domain-containing protein [Polymorphospora sp. NPDC051019]|uniref:RICIN domain-containing protein n=1 Tax=Polymorphospora sp. NPDC051019 TaxID=3155725 RepID=UPI003447AF61
MRNAWKIAATTSLLAIAALGLSTVTKPDSPNSSTPAQPAARSNSTIDATSAGPFNLYNPVTGRCMDLAGPGASGPGSAVIQATCDNSEADTQQWYLDYRPGFSSFSLRNAKSGLCLDLPGTGAPANGTALIQRTCMPSPNDNQLFYYEDEWIRNVKGDRCVDVVGLGTGGNGAALAIYDCLAADDHWWQLLW